MIVGGLLVLLFVWCFYAIATSSSGGKHRDPPNSTE